MAVITRKITIANIALVFYYVLPNLSTSFLTLALLGLLISPETVSSILQCQQKPQNSINAHFNTYLDFPVRKKILVVIGAGLIGQLVYLLPNWLVVLLLAEVWAGWDFLVDYGIVELVQTQVVSAEASLRKLFEMIPRYQGQ